MLEFNLEEEIKKRGLLTIEEIYKLNEVTIFGHTFNLTPEITEESINDAFKRARQNLKNNNI